MNDDLEEKFQAIADKAVEEAEELDCEMDEFRAGLRLIRHTIQSRIDQVTDELGD